MLDLTKMSIPMVWPDEGAVKKTLAHYYAGNDSFYFPPSGQLLEVCAYTRSADDIGTWERENLDTIFFAWLMKLAEIKSNPVAMAAFRDASNRVLMHIHLRAKEEDKMRIAYQLRENDEKNRDTAGHSLLMRARSLASIQDDCEVAP